MRFSEWVQKILLGIQFSDSAVSAHRFPKPSETPTFLTGADHASPSDMPVAHKFEEIIAWQLSARLRDIVIDRSVAWQFPTRKLCDQLRDSARSAPRNLAEGFGRFKPREFAQFARVARGSLVETLNHLQEAIRCNYIDSKEGHSLLRLNKRALKATTELVKYLDSCKGRAPTGWDVAGG